jgi:hypothetical protein
MVPDKEIKGSKAILKGKTPDGQNFTFTFEKAYIGKRNHPLFLEKYNPLKGGYVGISFRLDGGKYDEITFIQIAHRITKDADKNVISAVPSNDEHKLLTGWNDPNSKSKGWEIDVLTNTTPFYIEDGAKAGRVNGFTGKKNLPALLLDAPATFKTDENSGIELITVAIGVKQGAKPDYDYLASVKWGIFTEKNGDVGYYPALPERLNKVPPELGNSLARWNALGPQRKWITISTIKHVNIE